MTLEEEAKQVVQAGINSTTPARLNFLHQELIGGYPKKWYCTTCPGKLKAVFLSLKMTYYTKPNTIMATSNRKYTLKNKKGSFRPFGSAKVYTNENLTDAIAAKLIKETPEYAKLFTIAGEPTAADEPTEKEQLQSEYEKLTGKAPAKSWTIDKLNEEIAEAKAAK